MRISLVCGGSTSISSITKGLLGSQATAALHLMTCARHTAIKSIQILGLKEDTAVGCCFSWSPFKEVGSIKIQVVKPDMRKTSADESLKMSDLLVSNMNRSKRIQNCRGFFIKPVF